MHILNFILALLFFFLVISLFTSWVVEFIAQQINLRGAFLDKKLRNALGVEWLDVLFEHPLLVHFKKDKNKPADSLNPEQVAKAIVSAVIPKSGESLEETIQKLPKSNFKDILLSCHQALEINNGRQESNLKALKHFEVEVLQWLNSYNLKITQWYKNLTRKYLFAVGLSVAVFFNVDVLAVAETLWKDAKLSNEVAQAAEVFTQDYNAGFSTDSLVFSEAKKEAHQIITDYQQSQMLPIGWGSGSFNCENTLGFQSILTKIIGFLITAFTVTLGAPFWYDMLRKVLDIKSLTKPNKNINSNA